MCIRDRCAIADEVSKVHAICVKCGQLASFSHRTVKNDRQVLLGETEEYEPLCRECYQQAIQADQKESGHCTGSWYMRRTGTGKGNTFYRIDDIGRSLTNLFDYLFPVLSELG